MTCPLDAACVFHCGLPLADLRVAEESCVQGGRQHSGRARPPTVCRAVLSLSFSVMRMPARDFATLVGAVDPWLILFLFPASLPVSFQENAQARLSPAGSREATVVPRHRIILSLSNTVPPANPPQNTRLPGSLAQHGSLSWDLSRGDPRETRCYSSLWPSQTLRFPLQQPPRPGSTRDRRLTPASLRVPEQHSRH
jgi:hypothetical protein